MAAITLAQVRQHVRTDLVDDALQRLINDAELDILERAGADGAQTQMFRGDVLSTVVLLDRAAASITSVVEEVQAEEGFGGSTVTTLAATDYELRPDGIQLERLSSGTNPRTTWGDVVTVIYTPTDIAPRRLRVAVDLVKLAIQYNALKSESIGDHSETALNYQDERERVLSALDTWRPFA